MCYICVNTQTNPPGSYMVRDKLSGVWGKDKQASGSDRTRFHRKYSSKKLFLAQTPWRERRLWKRSLLLAKQAWPGSTCPKWNGALSWRFQWKTWKWLFRPGVSGPSLLKGSMWGTGLKAQGVRGRLRTLDTQALPGSFEEGECGSRQLLPAPRRRPCSATGL